MDLTKLRYWQWVLISLAVGAAAVELRAWAGGLDGAAVPADLSGQQQRFEKALLGRVEGHALLRNLRVAPLRIPNRSGGSRQAHLIRADFCAGEAEFRNGRGEYVWRDSIFVVPVPYPIRPHLFDSDPSLAQRARAGRELTVLDLLDAARSVRGTQYSYAWWDAHPWMTFCGCSVAVIGLIFPALLHLATFGRLTRPREQKAALRAPVQISPVPSPTPGIFPALQINSAPPDVRAPCNEPAPVAAAAPVLRGERLVSADASESRDASYDMKPEDYYPTGRRPTDGSQHKKS